MVIIRDDGDEDDVAPGNKTFMRLVLKPGLYLAVGAAGGCAVGWSLIDSAYFAIVTSTTVGYGDFSVINSSVAKDNDMFKVAAMLYMFAGLLIVGDLISEMATRVVLGSIEKFKTKEEHERFINETPKERNRSYSARLMKAKAMLAGTILLGALFVRWNEDVTCVDALYWSTQTVTTIGYGDINLKHESSRFFCCLYIPMAVVIVTAVIAEITNVEVDRHNDTKRQGLLSLKMTKKLAQQIDDEGGGDGVITDIEFVRYMLVKEGLVSMHDFDRYLDHFREDFDVDQNGRLNYKDVFAKGHRVQFAKEGSQPMGTVIDPHWNGMVRVKIDGTGEENSYKAHELVQTQLLSADSPVSVGCLSAQHTPSASVEVPAGTFQAGSML
jgi:hypothetical protein